MKTAPYVFPSFTANERRVDNSIHIIGLLVAPIASVWLLGSASGAWSIFSLAIYCTGLVAMLSVSALYNMLPHIPAKEIVRRVDHAVIFVMIAGTYTPFLVNRLSDWVGLTVGVFVWLTALFGIVLAFAVPHAHYRLKMVLYLALGWVIILVISQLAAAVSPTTIALLAAGGVLYSIGAGFHLLQRLQFHNAIWHGFVLIAASLHFAAIAEELVYRS